MAKNKPRRVVIFLLFRCVSFVIILLPLKAGLKIGEWLGKLAFYILKKERNIALNNIDTAFGNSKSREEKEVIAREVFENLGKSFVELLALAKFNKNNIKRYIDCRGLEVIESFTRGNKGAIALSAHLGNWELLAHYFAIQGFPVNVIARRLRMEQFEKFLDRIRKRNRVNVLYRDASAKDVIGLLKENKFIGIMPDQDMKSVSGVFVDFFGRPAYTPDGPALLSFLTGAPIIPCFIVRKPFGHEIVIEEPMELENTGDREKDVLENTQRYTKVIENYIRRFPSQWVWFHERWKTKPMPVLILIIFLSLIFNCSSFAEKDNDAEQEVKSFSLVQYESDGEKKWELSGKSAHVEDAKVGIDGVSALVFGEESSLKLKAEEGNFDREKEILQLENNVVAKTTDGIQLVTDSLSWDAENRHVFTEDAVRIKKADFEVDGKGAYCDLDKKTAELKKEVTANMGPLGAESLQGGSRGHGVSSGPSSRTIVTCEGPLEINYNKNKATFYNSVKVQDAKGDIFADRIDVYFRPGTARIRCVAARGNVRIVNGENVTYSEKAIYLVEESRLVLPRKPKLVINSNTYAE